MRTRIYLTEINAIDPNSGDLKLYGGPEISAISFDDAQNYCNQNGLGYCKEIGELIEEIPLKKRLFQP